jgi:GTPase
VVEHRKTLAGSGEHDQRRREQQVKWMWAMFEDRLRGRLASDPALKARLPKIEAAVAAGKLSPAVAVDEIVEALGL